MKHHVDVDSAETEPCPSAIDNFGDFLNSARTGFRGDSLTARKPNNRRKAGRPTSRQAGQGKMEQFIKRFVRSPDGEWICVAPAELQTAQGRIQVAVGTRITRGSLFMGLELARMLDEQAENDHKRRGS